MARSKFENDYKVAINNILREIYGNTQYWGVGAAGNGGIIRPLNDTDDPKWSNYNFINTHYIVRDKIVIPYLKNMSNISVMKPGIRINTATSNKKKITLSPTFH